MASSSETFWDHLEVLRGTLLRIGAAVLGVSIVAFVCKDALFKIILWPTRPDFPLWKLLDHWQPADPFESITLINTDLAQQFIVHMQTALAVGALIVSPYILYELLRFLMPALYPHERRRALPAAALGFLLFWSGLAVSYWLIFPFTFRFLGTYQVADQICNYINLSSYTSTLLILCLLMGLLFELPVLCRLLAGIGLLTSQPMKRYRKHAIVAIFVLAAVITPTGDAFTLCLVALPICMLYEISILSVSRIEKRSNPEK
ncbi:MAG: twin-arginine translocase subunit TatC [Paludibacteraceae bacterium]|nr:twin-arginine translocase subunit TatC [Paludibacteraceae bacterium]